MKAIQSKINALFIPTKTAKVQNHSDHMISPILLTNSWSHHIIPVSFFLAYQVTKAEVIGESNATINEFKKLKRIIAKKLL